MDDRTDKEPAEGSRETVDDALKSDGKDRGGADAPQGITNRTAEEEKHEQEELPPRGSAKREG